MIEFVPVLALLALVYAVINFLKEVTNKQVNAVVTQLITWVAGVVGVWLFSESDFGSAIAVGETGYTLSNINFSSLILVGLTIGSLAMVAYDLKKAIDRTDSAVAPKLLPDNTPDA